MRKERCASAALATVYRISHRLIMSVELSKNLKKKFTFTMLIDSLMICNDCIKVNNDVMIEEDVEKELTCLT